MRFIILLLLISLAINGLLGLALVRTSNQSAVPTDRAQEYPLLARRIFGSQPSDILINFTQLRSDLRSYLTTYDQKTGIYFEYLPSGISIGINEKEDFLFASLLKLPVAMAIYKTVSKGNLRMDEALTLQEEHKDTGFGSLWKKATGTKLTVSEAINISLKQSDNTANKLLLSRIPISELSTVFDALDIPKAMLDDKLSISPKNYSSVLKSLFFSSYLEENQSQEILSILTKTEFPDMLHSGIPDDIPVAHKIGIHDDKGIYLDCGIIYVPSRPYLLCIMTRELSKEEATTIMRDIAAKTYAFVSSANNKLSTDRQ